MRLDELLNSNVSGKVIKQTENVFITSAEIGNRTIRFSADSYGPEQWEIAFLEQSSSKGDTFGTSGSGNELQVFSFIVESIKLFISMYAPAEIYFTSEPSEGSRSKLYARMIKKISVPGYTNSVVPNTGNHHFQIIRDK